MPLKWIHGALRRAYLAVDRLFVRVFGEALNPLHYLGAIGCFMLVVVVATGFYVYAFYETGIATTYASVERLSTAQPWAGGLMRSLHRYASDALVLVMLLHMLRHFAFDRYRGFRAFSWVTGVVLLWLVYVSGVNGYMLPWDRLAQYTVTATAEWLDALPVFRGTLIRNFILPEAITDRFFSLLQFLHIGIPLAALAAMWIHVQRVPRARILPPRAFAIGLMAMMLVLSIVLPATGQGPADLGSLPAQVKLDWFYLAVLPLVQAWDAMALTWLVGGATAFVLALPWLPPKRAGQGAAWQLSLHPGRRTVAVKPGETLLEAALRAEVPIPNECRAGACGRCRATVLAGRVDDGGELALALTPAQRARGEVLTCVCTPLSDVEIEFEPGGAAADAGPALYPARVVALERLAPEVMKLVLRLDRDARIAWQAGQYVNLLFGDESGATQRRAYSFTAPGGTANQIELHIRRIEGGRFTTRVFETMRVGDAIEVEGPLGSFVLHEPAGPPQGLTPEGGARRSSDAPDARPVIFVAGATGFAPVKSLLEEAFRMRLEKPLHLYWGVRTPADLYLAELPARWAAEHPNFRYVPVVSEPKPGDGWSGRTGLVHEAILEDFPDLSGAMVYACGSLRMVENARPAFVAQGLSEDACFSDAFTPQATTASTTASPPARSAAASATDPPA